MGLRDSLRNLIRRRTPTPVQDDVYNMGINERRMPQHYAGKYLYQTAENYKGFSTHSCICLRFYFYAQHKNLTCLFELWR